MRHLPPRSPTLACKCSCSHLLTEHTELCTQHIHTHVHACRSHIPPRTHAYGITYSHTHTHTHTQECVCPVPPPHADATTPFHRHRHSPAPVPAGALAHTQVHVLSFTCAQTFPHASSHSSRLSSHCDQPHPTSPSLRRSEIVSQ